MRCLVGLTSLLFLPIVFGPAHGQIDSARALLTVDSAACQHYFDLATSYMMPSGRDKEPDYVSAAILFEKCVACDANWLRAYVLAAACYMEEENFPRSRERLAQALRRQPGFLPARIWMTRYYMRVDSPDTAVKNWFELSREIKADPKRYAVEAAETYYVIAAVNFQEKRYGDANTVLQEALDCGITNDARLHLLWGKTLLMLLDPKAPAEDNRLNISKAIEHFRKTVRLEPENVQGHLWLGQSLLMVRTNNPTGPKADACREFQTVLRLDPQNEDAKKAMKRIGCGK